MAGAFDDFFKYAPVRTRLEGNTADPGMRALHAAANRAAFRNRPAIIRQAVYLAEALTWPLTCWAMCLRADVKLDRAVETTGLSRGAYLRRQWSACVRLKIPPREYLHFAFHDAARLSRAGDFLYDIENWRLVGLLNEGVDIAPLQDKVAFANRCQQHGLPTPPILGLFSQGAPVFLRESEIARSGDLFLKPRGAKAGAGMRRVAGPLSAEIIASIAQASRISDLILQPAIANDAETASFTTGALSTARIMTGRYPDGRIVPIGAFLRLARGEAVVDNISAGGLMATVDLDSGEISAANRRWDPYVLVDRHPDTGALFAGKTLPQWREIVEVAVRAHAAFPQFAFVSWDIAPTPGGPSIIEGNHHGGTVAFQEINGRPLSQTPFADVVLANLQMKRAAVR
jgi:hypothetical protein